MDGPWENEEELIECMLHWQRKALEAENERDEILDMQNKLIDDLLDECDRKIKWQERALQAEKERDYYKQQFLDKDEEMKIVLDSMAIELGRKIVAIKYLKDEL